MYLPQIHERQALCLIHSLSIDSLQCLTRLANCRNMSLKRERKTKISDRNEVARRVNPYLGPVQFEQNKIAGISVRASKSEKQSLSSRSSWLHHHHHHHHIFHLFNAYSLPHPSSTSYVLRTALQGIITSILLMRWLRPRALKGLVGGPTIAEGTTGFRTCVNHSR